MLHRDTSIVKRSKVRTDDFKTITRQRSFDAPTDIDHDLLEVALRLFERQKIKRPIRLVGFGVSGFCLFSDEPLQVSLFEEFDQRKEKERYKRLDQTVDKLRDQYGQSVIKRGVSEKEKR